MKVERFLLLLCAAAGLPGSAVVAWAAPATTTTLTMTSGGSPVTSVVSPATVTLTATVTAGGTPVTPGMVNFCDAAASHCTDIHLLGTAQLTAAGTATLRLRPGVGSHSYKAVFTATANFATSSSSSVALSVTRGIRSSTTTLGDFQGNFNPTKATVTGNYPIAPTGTVAFIDNTNGNAVLGSAALVAGGACVSHQLIEPGCRRFSRVHCRG